MEIRQIRIDYGSKSGVTGQKADNYIQSKALPWLTVYHAVKGSCTVRVGEGQVFDIAEGGYFITPSKHVHTVEMKSKGEGTALRWAHIGAKINRRYLLDDLCDIPVVIPEGKNTELCFVFDELFCSEDLFGDYSCYYKILRIVFSLSKPKKDKAFLMLNKATSFVEHHYSNRIAVSELARLSNLSLSRFYAVFGDSFGVSPINYINSYRLAIASEILLSSNSPIADISNEVGILDPIYFNKMFRRSYGVSPSNFRKLYKHI